MFEGWVDNIRCFIFLLPISFVTIYYIIRLRKLSFATKESALAYYTQQISKLNSILNCLIDLLPATFHSDEADVISSEGMFQYIKDIIPTRENKNFCYWICMLNPQNSSCDCLNLQNIPDKINMMAMA